MKSLEERQAERVQRKADNAAFSTDKASSGIGAAAVAIAAAQDLVNGLDDADKDRLKEMVNSFGSDGFVNEAYGADGHLKAAGVGVTNPAIIPVDTSSAAGWGDPPVPAQTPEGGNQNGQAIPATPASQTPSDAEADADASKGAKA